MSPLCQTHIKPEELNQMEPFYPLRALVCERCWLVQLDEFVSPDEIFSEYDYFSSYSDTWVAHAKNYVEMISHRLDLNEGKFVVEVASNDGYLLQHFAAKNIPHLGVEPAANVAEAAIAKGISCAIQFFGVHTAHEILQTHGPADLLLGNNVLAHVPDINDLVAGLKILLKPGGTLTMEFPHLLKLIDENQFDTIYHEHFSYLSFFTVEQIFAHQGLTLFDVEEIPTHGGSLRIYGRHHGEEDRPVSARAKALRAYEIERGICSLPLYQAFEERVKDTKRKLLDFLIEAKREKKKIVGYGAPGKGNTLLNYCAIRTDFLDFTVDRSPQKQGKFTPGCRLPILHPEALQHAKPDYVLILPWNLKDEIMAQHSYIREWGGRFVIAIPEVLVFE